MTAPLDTSMPRRQNGIPGRIERLEQEVYDLRLMMKDFSDRLSESHGLISAIYADAMERGRRERGDPPIVVGGAAGTITAADVQLMVNEVIAP